MPLADPDAENLRARVTDPKRDGDRILTFLDVNGMEPTNNHAEQSLRLPVIFRKICLGNRSVLGAETLSTNLSLITGHAARLRQVLEQLLYVIHRSPPEQTLSLLQPL